MASPPKTIMMIAMTQANTGRSKKNLDNITPLPQFDFAAGGAVFLDSTPSFRPALNGTTLTEAPGRAFWIPSTMTRSPICWRQGSIGTSIPILGKPLESSISVPLLFHPFVFPFGKA